MKRGFLLLLLGLFSIFLQAKSQSSEPRDASFTDDLQQNYSETVSRNAAQDFACGIAPVGSYYSSHFAGVSLKEHPEACGKCLQAMCVDRVQCKSPFLNVTVVVIDDCPDCGEGGVSMNSLAVRELTGRSLEEDNTEKVKVEWFLFDCSAATPAVAVSTSPPPPAPAPVEPLLAPPAPEESIIQEKEVSAVAVSPPAVEEEVVVAQLAAAPSPEVEEIKQVEEETPVVVPAPEPETTLVEESAAVAVAVPTPDPELAEEIPAPAPEPPQPEVIPNTASSVTTASSYPAPEPEILALVAEPVAEINGIAREATVVTTTPPAPYPPPPASPAASPAPEVEEKQQTQQQKQGNKEENSKNGNGVQTNSYYGVPGDDVLTLPRVGKVGVAVPVDYQPFPEQAFANIACGFASVSTYFETHFAGIAASNEACGSCLAVRCADSAKCPYGTETVVQVVDTCGTCGVNDVNISPDALKAVMGENNENSNGGGNNKNVMVTWRKVPCRGQIEGSMYLHMINGGSDNEYYAQMSLSNAAQEIQSVRINEQSLTKMSGIGGGRWEWQNGGNKLNLALPAVLEVTGMDGKVAKVEIQKFESQELPSGGQI